jgi:hypothetical protein
MRVAPGGGWLLLLPSGTAQRKLGRQNSGLAGHSGIAILVLQCRKLPIGLFRPPGRPGKSNRPMPQCLITWINPVLVAEMLKFTFFLLSMPE